jgi:2-polyprenyl-3-methyl-5-hydroxy-6-metoxy-1,4-benzoquinol methylase
VAAGHRARVEISPDIVGINWSANAIGYASMLVPGARFFAGDLLDSEFLKKFPEKFDAAALIEVIEHIPPNDCVAALQGISSVLKPGTTFVLTTPSTSLPSTSTHIIAISERCMN